MNGEARHCLHASRRNATYCIHTCILGTAVLISPEIQFTKLLHPSRQRLRSCRQS